MYRAAVHRIPTRLDWPEKAENGFQEGEVNRVISIEHMMFNLVSNADNLD